jgi:hypothetical protein
LIVESVRIPGNCKKQFSFNAVQNSCYCSTNRFLCPFCPAYLCTVAYFMEKSKCDKSYKLSDCCYREGDRNTNGVMRVQTEKSQSTSLGHLYWATF